MIAQIKGLRGLLDMGLMEGLGRFWEGVEEWGKWFMSCSNQPF